MDVEVGECDIDCSKRQLNILFNHVKFKLSPCNQLTGLVRVLNGSGDC